MPIERAKKIVAKTVFIAIVLTSIFFVGFDLLHLGFHFLEEGFYLGAEMITDCDQVRKLLRRSGIARDAKEHSLGRIELKEPGREVSTTSDQATWWGEFKPFRLWGKPRLKSQWVDPGKNLVYEKKFAADKCRLAKVKLPFKEIPAKIVPGVWEVRILCQNQLIDSQEFVMYQPGSSETQAGGGSRSAGYQEIVVDGKEI